MLQIKLEEWTKLGEWLKQWHNDTRKSEGKGKATGLNEREWSVKIKCKGTINP